MDFKQSLELQLSMDNPQLIINADANKIGSQIESWSKIVQLSTQIQTEVNNSNSSAKDHWSKVLSLADKRDKLVEAFFEEGVSQILLPQIVDDLEDMKTEHAEIMSSLRDRDNAIKIDEDFLRNAKDQIRQLSPT